MNRLEQSRFVDGASDRYAVVDHGQRDRADAELLRDSRKLADLDR